MRATLLISCAATALMIGIGSAGAQTAEHKSGPALGKESPAAAATQSKSATPDHGMAEHRSAAEDASKAAKDTPKPAATTSPKPSSSMNEPKMHQGANEKASPNAKGAANDKAAAKPEHGAANDKTPPTTHRSASDKVSSPSQSAQQSKQKPSSTTAQTEKQPGSATAPKTGRSAATGKTEPNAATSTNTPTGRSATTGTEDRINRKETNANVQERTGAAGSVQIDAQKQERIRSVLASSKAENVRKVDFSVSVGTRIPERYHFYPLPSEIVQIVPEYRGYEYMVVDNEIVIVNPRTREIVYTMTEGRSAGMNRPSVDCR
jgi:Protein of unknown function (DUF1236)